MNFKKFVVFNAIVFLFMIVLSSLSYGQVIRYLNSTDGDDSYTGLAENNTTGNGPKRTFEAAYRIFPDGAIVYVKCGEYYYDQSGVFDSNLKPGGNDADGINFDWTTSDPALAPGATGKSMTFILQTYNSSNTVFFNGPVAGPLIFKLGTGTITFQKTVDELISINNGPHATTATNAINLVSGTVNTSGLGSFQVGGSVTTMTRTDGQLSAGSAFTYSSAARNMIYNSTANSAQTTGGELQTALAGGTLDIQRTQNTLTVAQDLTATNGGEIKVTGNGNATFSGAISVSPGAGVAPSPIENFGTGTMTLNGAVTIGSKWLAPANGFGTCILNNAAGKVIVNGALTFKSTQTSGVGGDLFGVVQNTAGGTLTLAGLITFTPYVDGASVKWYPLIDLENVGAGTVNIGSSGSAWYNRITNNGGGTINLIGDLSIYDTGNFTPNVTIDNNAAGSKVKINGYTLTVTFGSNPTASIQNAGSVSSTGIGVGLLKYTNPVGDNAVITGVGGLPNIEVAGKGNVTATGVTTISGNVNLTSSGMFDLNTAGNVTITGSVGLAGAGSIFDGPSGDLTINQNINISNGTFRTDTAVPAPPYRNVYLLGNFTQTGGAWVFSNASVPTTWPYSVPVGDMLDVKGNFNRTTGAFDNAEGMLRLSGGTASHAQILAGGPNFAVYDLSIFYTSTNVTLTTGSVEVHNTVFVDINATIQLGDLNIRMVGLGTGPTAIKNHGNILSSTLGSVIFEGTWNPTGGSDNGVHYIGGDGKYTNLEVRLADPQDYINVINQDGMKALFTGRLNLFKGGIRIPNGCQVNPVDNSAVTGNIPSIYANLSGAPDYQDFSLGGTGAFNVNAVTYDLLYYGTQTANRNLVTGGLGTIFQDGLVRNLTIQSVGGFQARLNTARTITGNLYVATAPTELRLQSASLTATTSTSSTHTILGTVSEDNTGAQFILAGTGNHVVNGGVLGTDPSIVQNLTCSSTGTVGINNLIQIGKNNAANMGLTVNSGAVTLKMQNDNIAPAAYSPGNVFNFTQNGGSVVLGADMEVPAFANTSFNVAGASLTFDFAAFNIWWNSANVFTSVGTTTFNNTGATDGTGYLQYRSSGGLNTAGALVPRIIIDPAAAGGITCTLSGNSGVSQIFTNTNGTLALGTFNFTNAGTQWNSTGLYTGTTGQMILTGPVNVSLSGAITVPNLTLNSTTNTVTLIDNWTGGVPSITVTALVKLVSGTLNMGVLDIIMNDAQAVGTVFDYVTATTVNATTTNNVTATDDQNGEFVFDGATAKAFKVEVAGMVLPNVRVAGTGNITLAASPNNNAFTISQRLVLANTGDLNVGADGKLTIGDGAWIKRMNDAGILDKVPTFGTTGKLVSIEYEAAANINAAKEMPAEFTGLYIDNAAGISTWSSKNITVDAMLWLNSGNYDFEKAIGTIYTITMAANSTVMVNNGWLINNASPTPAGASTTGLLGGPVTLDFINTAARTTSSREYPSTAGFVKLLKVESLVGAATSALVLHADRSCVDLILDSGEFTPTPANNVEFDLNGNTLHVTNTSSAVLTRGMLVSRAANLAGQWVYGTLDVTGSLTSTANASIMNVNVNAATMNLAGAYGVQDWDGGGGNVLVGLPTATVTGISTVAAFAGNLIGHDNITINGAYSQGTCTADKDVTVTSTGSLATATNLVFASANNSKLTLPGNNSIGMLTLSKTNPNNTITLVGGNLNVTNTTTFNNGLFVTGDNIIYIYVPFFGFGQGFVHNANGTTTVSHVVGNCGKMLFNGGGGIFGLSSSPEPRQEWPVGNMTTYDLVAITFNPQIGGLPTTPNSTIVVKYVDGNAGGFYGLPIMNGVADGMDVGLYPGFYWSIYTTPTSIGPTIPFDMELTAANGFSYNGNPNEIRIIRRHSLLVNDTENKWLLQNYNDIPNPTAYDNSINSGVPTVIVRGANAGLRVGGAIFTYGLKSKIKATNPIPDHPMKVGDVETFDLSHMFVGYTGTLTFSVESSYADYCTATLTAPATLELKGIAVGTATITVFAQDSYDSDMGAFSFNVNVNNTTDVKANEIPTEFALMQNYPNPFNPTTNIKFDLPKESNVRLTVYNILGEQVATLVNGVLPAGHQEVKFDATKLASGMYIYRIEAGSFVQVKKMLLMK